MPHSDQPHRDAIRQFDFVEAYNEIGWDHLDVRPPVLTVEGQSYRLEPIAEKRGVQVYTVTPDAEGQIPPRAVRQKLDRKVTNLAREHLLIYADAARSKQIWQWVDHQPGKPSAFREHTWYAHQDPEALVQKLRVIAFDIGEEDAITLSEVTFRLRDALDKTTVTKKFYKEFDWQRKAFLKRIRGIGEVKDCEWYCSALLNRLMFVYFLQRKGFLDDDRNYLRNRLTQCQDRFGEDEFYSFYRTFLLRLFHDGLGKPRNPKDVALRDLLGEIPYLNGGLFQLHEVEAAYDAIAIPDEAFEALFGFFDQWDWTLDYRPLQTGSEINPDVLGYIFEQYINNKQMGAYYTKEDITGYITRYTLLPFVLEDARRRCRVAFEGDTSVWRLLREDPDRYIYCAVRKTARDTERHPLPFPDEIAAGLDDVSKRGPWNTLTPQTWGLPTEIWRETVARRRRYDDLRARLAAGEIHDVADLITHKLDIEQFTLDAIQTCEGPDLLRAFWRALRAVTVLDPTCGSGAFLFAALERLEHLYTACLERMEAFIGDLDADKKASPHALKDFRAELEAAYDTTRHPNLTYFVLKRILLDNLYGVDIMPEAVEICKLRLFLKLAAQVDTGSRLEPLPDIDFNVRTGNTLVGYATLEQARQAVQSKLDFDDAWTRIEAKAMDVAILAELFREQQTKHGGDITPDDKKALREQLAALADELNGYLAAEYGVKKSDEAQYHAWLTSHQPFHWCAEFYNVMSADGFDVIIGNPPYVQYAHNSFNYKLIGYQTLGCKDLYAFVTERSLTTLKVGGRMGLIVPISVFNTDGFKPLQSLVRSKLSKLYASHYSNRPSQLFSGAQKRLTILMGEKGNTEKRIIYSTRYFRWSKEEREYFFDACLNYHAAIHPFSVFDASLEKLGSELEASTFQKLNSSNGILATATCRSSSHKVYYTRSFQYFLAFLNFIPEMEDIETGERKLPSELKELEFRSSVSALGALASLSSSTFFWFWHVLSDCRNLNKRDVLAFPVNLEMLDNQLKVSLRNAAKKYLNSLKTSSSTMLKSGMYIQTFDYGANKLFLDKIDSILARHYGFTDEELDFIINYDIKYRLGLGAFAQSDVET